MQPLFDLLQQALDQHQLKITDLSALASSNHKQDEPGLQQLAMHLQLPLVFASAELLGLYTERLTLHSPLSLRITGSAGVAQASALALAEQLSARRAELIGERLNNANATCAIAVTTILETP